MSATVKTCVMWVKLPTKWPKRCRKPESMRRRFGKCTPQPFPLLTPPGPMYLFCVAMSLERATEILATAEAQICCQPVEGYEFSVSRYTPRHMIRATNRTTASGEEEYDLTYIL